MVEKADRIREMNDSFRQSFVGGQVLLSMGVDRLPPKTKQAVLTKVRTYDAFNEGNDPSGEHNIITVEHDGERYLAKMDYYAPDLGHSSDDPADQSKTFRVLTVMKADER